MMTPDPPLEGTRSCPSRTLARLLPPWPRLGLLLPPPHPQRVPCRPHGGPRTAVVNMVASGTSNSVPEVSVWLLWVVTLNHHTGGWRWWWWGPGALGRCLFIMIIMFSNTKNIQVLWRIYRINSPRWMSRCCVKCGSLWWRSILLPTKAIEWLGLLVIIIDIIDMH